MTSPSYPMYHLDVYLAVVPAAVLLFIRLCRGRRRSLSMNLPPGPPRDALLGNARLFMAHASQLERPFRGETFHEWAKVYGDVMYLEVFGKRMVVLDSVEAATELLEKRGAKYSSRPKVAILNMIGWENVLGFLPYGEALQTQRGIAQRYIGHEECHKFEETLKHEALGLVNKLMDSLSDERNEVLQRYMVAISIQLMYGRKITDDRFVRLVEDLAEAIVQSDSFLADCFPLCARITAWFPFSTYSKSLQRAKVLTNRVLNSGFDLTRGSTACNEQSFTSLVETYLDPEQLSGSKRAAEWNEHVKHVAGMCYWAASDTVYGTLVAFIFALITHPEIQHMAHEELDKVVGQYRIPDFGDRKQLPYVESILQETLRWRPVAPVGVPHVTTEEDVYRGMTIPKNTIVIANLRGMTLDEKVYHNPTAFSPNRFMPKSAGGREEPFLSPFGFGRRICPGRHLADKSLWIAIVSLLATCHIKKAVDDEGHEITPKVEFTNNIAVTLAPFPFSLIPRSEYAPHTAVFH